jgi:hypothetical protein
VAQRGASANIPPKRNRKEPICFSPHLYRARNLVERFFDKIKQCPANYLAFVKLASICLLPQAYESMGLFFFSPLRKRTYSDLKSHTQIW